MKRIQIGFFYLRSSYLLFGALFFFLISCSTPPKPLTMKNVIKRRTLPLSLEIEKEISKYLIQEPDQELSVKLYKLIKGKDKLVSHQKVKGIKIPSVIRLKVKETKYDIKRGTVYTVIIRLHVNSKNRFKGFLIIPHWRSTERPLSIPLRKYWKRKREKTKSIVFHKIVLHYFFVPFVPRAHIKNFHTYRDKYQLPLKR